MAAARRRHLVIDARALRAAPSGVGVAVFRQVQGLDKILRHRVDWRVTVLRLGHQLGDSSYRQQWAQFQNIAVIDCPADPMRHPAADWWQQVHLPRLLEQLSADVVYSPAFIGPLRLRRTAQLLMIHDDLVWSQADSYPWHFKLYLRKMSALSARRSTRVIYPSEDARRRVGLRLGLPEAKTAAVLHGVDLDLYRDAPLAGREPYALCIANPEQRKNHEVLLKALGGLQGMRLVFAGLSGPGSSARLRQMKKLDNGASWEVLPALPEKEIVNLLRRAAMLVSPSLGEGFGMPLLEAMACGTPVIASRIPVMEEVAGGAAAYCDPRQPDEWREAMRTALSPNQDVANRRAEGLRRAGQLSLENNASQLLEQAEKAIQQRRTS